MKGKWIVLVVVSLFCLCALAIADDAPAEGKTSVVGSIPVFDATNTTVVVLPVSNQSGKQNEENDKLCIDSADIIRQIFTDRGFKVVSVADVASCLAKSKLSIDDEETRTKSQLLSIGKSLSSNIIVSAVIQDMDTRMNVGILVTKKVGKAKVLVKMLHVDGESYLINATFEGGKKGGIWMPIASKSKSLRACAVANALSTAFEDFVKPYKMMPKPEDQKTEETK